MVFYFLSCHGYHAPLVLGKYVCIHIFLSIVLFKPDNHFSFPLVCLNLFYDLYDISSNNPLLAQTPRCTTLSVRPCYYCWWHSGNHRWVRTLPIGSPRSTSGKMVSLCSSSLVPTLLPAQLTSYSLTCLPVVAMQDVTTLPTFNPHGGPITHSSTGSNPDSHVYPVVKVIPRAWLCM